MVWEIEKIELSLTEMVKNEWGMFEGREYHNFSIWWALFKIFPPCPSQNTEQIARNEDFYFKEEEDILSEYVNLEVFISLGGISRYGTGWNYYHLTTR